MNFQKQISIVSPVYKAEDILTKLVEEISTTMIKIGVTYEIILVDDRSPDNSWQVMQQLSQQFGNIINVRLSRNFGQHPAIIAGLSIAKGEWVVVMDCDLQDQPQEIEKLYQKAIQGYDIVLAKRENRKDGFFKRLSSRIFSIIYSYLTETNLDNSIANFGIYRSHVIKEVLEMKDYMKSFPLFIKWVGFNSTSINVDHAPRYSGNSSYNLKRMLKLAFDTVISFSNKPLKLFVNFGLLISFCSFVIGLITIIRYLNGQITVLGYSSLMVSIWFLFGVLITVVGVVGIYIGKIFDQTKGRNSFIIDKIISYEN